MNYLRNLSSQEILTGVLPWDFKPTEPIPDNVHTDKVARHEWITLPSTDHCVYTFCQGVNANLRISKGRKDGEGNPIHSTSALIADYDAKQPEETVMRFASELPYPPNWIERTLSGNCRFVWLLEEPLAFPSHDFARHFLKAFAEFAFDPALGMIGFDRGAWEAPDRLYTNACDWRKLTDAKIPADVSRGWLVKASESFKFSAGEFGAAIPLDDLKPELAKRFPRFADWPGEFVTGAQGPTFWVDASTSPKSAIVRDTGIQTFSAHAPKAFYSWADLVGIAFCRNYEASAAGRAVAGIYYDGRLYWRQLEDGKWRSEDKSDLILHLRCDRGVSHKRNKDGTTDAERAVSYVRAQQNVQAVAPFVYQPSGILFREGRQVLNTSTVRVLTPAEGKAVWGHGGQLPWVSHFLDRLFSTTKQRDILVSWGAWAYRGAYIQKPESGQTVFIAGPVGVGKTLLNRCILGVLFGGFAEAGPYLLGDDKFGSELFATGYWVIDDNEASADQARTRKWTSALKRISANSTFRCHEKFKTPANSEWQGRLVVTCNADEESVQLLPDLAQSILDKLILLRTAPDAPCDFPPRYELKKILDQELPWLARYLLDYEIPVELRGNSRFGVKDYAEPSLLDTARQSCQVAGFREILEDWHKQYFTITEKEANHWEGTAYQFHKQIMLDPSAAIACRTLTPTSVGRKLSSLLNNGEKRLEIIPGGATRIWRIYRNEPPTKKTTKP